MFEQKQTHAYKSKCKKKNIKHKQQNEHKYMKQQLKLKQSNTNISNWISVCKEIYPKTP